MAAGARTSPLGERNFRLFYLGELVNTVGSSMAAVSLAFAVLAIDNSPSALGWVAAASTAPMVAFMLLGGALADRLPRSLVLRGCNLTQAAIQAVTASLVLTHQAHVWQLVVLQLVSGTAFAISYPAIHGMVPILLPAEQRKAAYLLINQTAGALRILGPATAGVLVATIGPGWALGFDAATYIVAAGFLAALALPFGARPERQASVIGDFKVGWTFVRKLGWVLPVASGSLVFNALISGSIMVLGPTIAHSTIGAGGWGIARSGQAVGLLAATLVLARVTLRRPLMACVLAFVLTAAPMLVLGTWVHTTALTAAFVVAGVGSSIIDLAWSLTVQEKVPEEMLSRVMAIDGFFSFVAMPVGEVLVGPFAHAFGARSVELGSIAICVLVGAVGATRPVIRNLRLTGPAG
ncbi:MAG TPA: MFS transporter [Galbitalea sp.]|jgi:MFS family permease